MGGGIDRLLAMVAHSPNTSEVFANPPAGWLKMLTCDGAGMCTCTRLLEAGIFAWRGKDSGSTQQRRDQLDWLVASLQSQRLGAPQPQVTKSV